MAALFLCREPPSSGSHQHVGIRLNLLLQFRFPAFFSRSIGTDESSDRGLAPWYTTHCAESVRPWPRNPPGDRRCTLGTTLASPTALPTKQLDPIGHATYARQEASWRRMIPCFPAPTKLQMYREYKPFQAPR